MDFGTLDVVGQFLRIAAAAYDDLDAGTGRTADEGRHFVERQPRDGFLADAHQDVAGPQAGLLCRRIFIDLDDARLRVARADADADADVGVVAARPRLVVLVLLLVQEIGVALVDEADHAADQGMRRDEAFRIGVRSPDIRGQCAAHRFQVGGAIA